jgi:hypothetical protein
MTSPSVDEAQDLGVAEVSFLATPPAVVEMPFSLPAISCSIFQAAHSGSYRAWGRCEHFV